MEERRNVKKIRIVRPIIVDGKHAAVGEVHSLPRGKAIEIVNTGCAEDMENEAAPTTVRIEKPVNGDPKPQNGDPATGKRAPEPQKTKSAS